VRAKSGRSIHQVSPFLKGRIRQSLVLVRNTAESPGDIGYSSHLFFIWLEHSVRSQILGVIYDLVGSSKKNQDFISTTAQDQSKSIVGIPVSTGNSGHLKTAEPHVSNGYGTLKQKAKGLEQGFWREKFTGQET
jgi:hypothetical protein